MFADYLNDTAYRIRETKNKFNEVLSADEITIQCRSERLTKNAVTKAGKEVMTSFLFFLPFDSDIVETDKLKYQNKTYEIISISHESGFEASHKEVYI